jgi:chemotaxis signal transduction protein
MDLAGERSGERSGVGVLGHAGRVLVFSVDDGLFGVHLDWVEAVYEQRAVETHRVRIDKGPWHAFLLHRGEPALIIDLRDAFDLGEVLGQPERAAYAIVHSGGYRLAVAIDQVAGVQELALDVHRPLPANLLRDGGIPVGHVVQLDDRMLVVLDPHRLLSGERRAALEPIWSRARAYAERHDKMERTWRDICREPSEENVRLYSRLCGRNGRRKAAAAARTVLKAMAEARDGASTNGATPPLVERVVGEVLRCAARRATGIVQVAAEQGPPLGAVFMVGGRMVDAQANSEWGRMALKTLLSRDGGRVTFFESDLADHPERLSESSAALLISSLEAVALEQRKRRAR